MQAHKYENNFTSAKTKESGILCMEQRCILVHNVVS